MQILVIDDNETLRDGVVQILRQQGHTLSSAAGGQAGLEALRLQPVDLVLTDYKMDGMNGLALMQAVKAQWPQTGVMVMTAFGTIDLAVDAMKAGAWDFITKPFSREALTLKVSRFEELHLQKSESARLAGEKALLQEELETRLHFGELVGESPAMTVLYQTVEKVAPSETSVLILGESGTGKELAARAIHRRSRRNQRPFVRVNCGALAEGLLESELFGHEKGAFTGAVRLKKGRFELAHGGTLFLDEIGDLSPGLQVKLLRVLQEKEFERVGGEETLQVDVRVIAATHRDLLASVKAGRFREDLYYRLFIVPVFLPPLRERRDDIPLLADHFLKSLSADMGRPPMTLTQTALDTLKAYHWPGNIRELSNVLERAVVLASGTELDRSDLLFTASPDSGAATGEMGMDLEARLAEVERKMLVEALTAAGGVKARTARILGIKTSALYYKLEKYGLLENGAAL